ncbi:MAG TPA: thiamine-phosphate kinase [Phycisphaerae bacterium]|nr:thiamine-phosphate kinase [Phycisphaerae bacterium]
MSKAKGEWKLINWIRARTRVGHPRVPLGPGDDMAILSLAREDRCLLTVDALVDGTHFDLAKASPRKVGYKALAVSLSDAAAMAALPVAAVAWVALPAKRTMAFAKQISRGLADAAERFDCPIVGGDIVSGSGPLSVGTALVARAAGVKPVRRSGARPGDALFVTGTLGGSLLGRHLCFTPRVREARRLAQTIRLHAMIDLSDGLSTDLAHLCEESGVAAEVEARAVPISRDARQLARKDGRPALEHALNDGEDFELLFAVGPRDAKRLLTKNPLARLRLTRIGRVTRGRKVTLVGADGHRKVLEPRGWEHFR